MTGAMLRHVRLRRWTVHARPLSTATSGAARFYPLPLPPGAPGVESWAAPPAPPRQAFYASFADAVVCDQVLSATGARAWVNLLPAFTPEQCPRAFLESRGVRYVHLPVAAPDGLDGDLSARVLSTIAALPPHGPLVIQCASGNRASAVLALYVGVTRGWTATATLAWAADAALPFLAAQPLRNWVCASISRARGGRGSVGPVPTPSSRRSSGVLVRQLWHAASSSATYLLGDRASGDAILIDPVLECAERDVALVRELGLRLRWALSTHVHADHLSGTARLRTLVPRMRSAIGRNTGALSDRCLEDGDEIEFGAHALRVISTPGHTSGCVSYVLDDDSAVFTGDCLLIRGCGRTDHQGGSPRALFASVSRLFSELPPECVLYPGHDYAGATHSSIGEEQDLNPRLGAARTLPEFEAVMASLRLPPPPLMGVAVPINLRDGVVLNEGGGVREDVTPSSVCVVCRQDGGDLPVWTDGGGGGEGACRVTYQI